MSGANWALHHEHLGIYRFNQIAPLQPQYLAKISLTKEFCSVTWQSTGFWQFASSLHCYSNFSQPQLSQ